MPETIHAVTVIIMPRWPTGQYASGSDGIQISCVQHTAGGFVYIGAVSHELTVSLVSVHHSPVFVSMK